MEACREAFERAKGELKSEKVLINYDPHKEIILTCDASDYGLSAILSHATPKGDRPIAYASKTLSKSELNYATIDKEARAIVFGVTKFYDYLYGQKFTLRTDHQPLVRIFGAKKGIPIMAACRLQRYADFLKAHTKLNTLNQKTIAPMAYQAYPFLGRTMRNQGG